MLAIGLALGYALQSNTPKGPVQAARTSRLFAQVEARDGQGTQVVPVVATTPGAQASSAGQPDRATVSPDRITPLASPYILQAGTVIAGVLNTKISSDLPGQIVGHVTQNVYDSPTGRYLLIPQGSLLFGAYNSSVSFGQQRTQIIWT
jgi:type IV secretion system protein VirB10